MSRLDLWVAGNKKQEQKKASGISEGSDASDTNGEDAYDSNFSGMSQPSDGGTDKEEDSKPGEDCRSCVLG